MVEGSVVSVAHSASNGVTEKESEKVGYRVLMPPARYIPLSVTDIVDSIKSHIPHSHRSGDMHFPCYSQAALVCVQFVPPWISVQRNAQMFTPVPFFRASSHFQIVPCSVQRDMPAHRG